MEQHLQHLAIRTEGQLDELLEATALLQRWVALLGAKTWLEQLREQHEPIRAAAASGR